MAITCYLNDGSDLEKVKLEGNRFQDLKNLISNRGDLKKYKNAVFRVYDEDLKKRILVNDDTEFKENEEIFAEIQSTQGAINVRADGDNAGIMGGQNHGCSIVHGQENSKVEGDVMKGTGQNVLIKDNDQNINASQNTKTVNSKVKGDVITGTGKNVVIKDSNQNINASGNAKATGNVFKL